MLSKQIGGGLETGGGGKDEPSSFGGSINLIYYLKDIREFF
jgi:hypothetical protein